jgi:hypothetical protein
MHEVRCAHILFIKYTCLFNDIYIGFIALFITLFISRLRPVVFKQKMLSLINVLWISQVAIVAFSGLLSLHQ